MKRAIALALALLFAVPNIFAAETISTIMNRKSVRSYEKTEISDTALDTILKAGMAAPSAMNKKPWSFIVIKRSFTLDAIGDNLPYAKAVKDASAAIVVCGTQDSKGYWIMDCSAAIQNMLLAIEDMGLGAVWCAVYPEQERVDFVKKTLSIPEGVTPLAVVPIGKPKNDPKPKDKYDASKIHMNKW